MFAVAGLADAHALAFLGSRVVLVHFFPIWPHVELCVLVTLAV